jgi:hypothetical protein
VLRLDELAHKIAAARRAHGHAAAAVSRSGSVDEHTAAAFPPRLRGRELGGVKMVLLDALAPGGRLASFSDSLEISCV